MAISDTFKMRSALMKHKNYHFDEAKAEYENLYQKGYIRAAYLLPYSTLLLREGGEENFKRVREILKKAEKAPDINKENKQQLHVNYAVALYKLGETAGALSLLEASHQSTPCTLTYQTLGYLYVDAGKAEKALAFNKTALEYDDEDSVILDNMGQTYYRCLDDHEAAKAYFEKALQFKENQIDTLYFLAKYDIEENHPKKARERLLLAKEGRFSPLNYATPERVDELLTQCEGAEA